MQSAFGEVTGKKAHVLSVPGTVLLKDKKLASLEYGKKQLLLTVTALILTWLI